MARALFVTPSSIALTDPTRIPSIRTPSSSCSSSLSTLRRAHPAASTHLRTPRLRVLAAVMAEKTVPTTPGISLDGYLHFAKYQGLGNDFILVDNRDSMEPRITPERAVKLCDRNFGVGADGVIFVMPGTQGTDYTMRIFNSDGSEPEMCGNGVRCFARFVSKLEKLQGEHIRFRLHTGAGLIVPEVLEDGKVRVDMGEPILKAADVPTKLSPNQGEAVVKAGMIVDGVRWTATCVSMGNPHCIVFGNERNQELLVDELNLPEIGPKFEHHEAFPARTNTEFVQVISPSHLKMRVWERGAGATLACGTGACATVVAAVLEGRAGRNCTVDLPGGPLEIEWREEDNHIYMTGPAEEVFCGSVAE